MHLHITALALLKCYSHFYFLIPTKKGPLEKRHMDAGLARWMYNIFSALSGFGIRVRARFRVWGFLQFQLGCKKLQSRQKCNKGKEPGPCIFAYAPPTPQEHQPCVYAGFFPSASMCVYVHSFGPVRLGKNANFLAIASENRMAKISAFCNLKAWKFRLGKMHSGPLLLASQPG